MDSKRISLDHTDLNYNMPELGKFNVFNGINLIKTHYLIYFHRGKKITILREPMDTLSSYYIHMCRNKKNYVGSIDDFLESKMGIIWLKKHLQYYIKLKKSKHNNLLIIKYMDLQKDLNILLANVIIQMGMAVDKELISLTLSKVTREKLISSEKSQKKSISSFSAIKNYDNIQSQISDDNKKLILELNVLYFSILDL
jgi:uncharacterized protein YueI